jgi:hypothetical protein
LGVFGNEGGTQIVCTVTAGTLCCSNCENCKEWIRQIHTPASAHPCNAQVSDRGDTFVVIVVLLIVVGVIIGIEFIVAVVIIIFGIEFLVFVIVVSIVIAANIGISIVVFGIVVFIIVEFTLGCGGSCRCSQNDRTHARQIRRY